MSNRTLFVSKDNIEYMVANMPIRIRDDGNNQEFTRTIAEHIEYAKRNIGDIANPKTCGDRGVVRIGDIIAFKYDGPANAEYNDKLYAMANRNKPIDMIADHAIMFDILSSLRIVVAEDIDEYRDDISHDRKSLCIAPNWNINVVKDWMMGQRSDDMVVECWHQFRLDPYNDGMLHTYMATPADTNYIKIGSIAGALSPSAFIRNNLLLRINAQKRCL